MFKERFEHVIQNFYMGEFMENSLLVFLSKRQEQKNAKPKRSDYLK